jgi:hypothetical protein
MLLLQHLFAALKDIAIATQKCLKIARESSSFFTCDFCFLPASPHRRILII